MCIARSLFSAGCPITSYSINKFHSFLSLVSNNSLRLINTSEFMLKLNRGQTQAISHQLSATDEGFTCCAMSEHRAQ